MKFQVFYPVPIATCPITGHYQEESVSSPSIYQCIFLQILIIPPPPPGPELSLLQAEQSQLSQTAFIWKMFLPLTHPHVSLLDYLKHVHIFLVLGSPDLDTVLQVEPYQCWARRMDHLPRPAGNALSNAAQEAVTFATRTLCLLMANLVSIRTLRSSGKLLTASLSSACTVAWGYSSPDFSFPFTELWDAFSEQFFSLSRSVWMVCQPLTPFIFFNLWTL